MTTNSPIQYFLKAQEARKAAIVIATSPVYLEGRVNLPAAAYSSLVAASHPVYCGIKKIEGARN